MSIRKIFGTPDGQEEEHWISVSDMMAGLMVVFLLIAIVYNSPNVEKQKKKRDNAVAQKEVDIKIYQALYEEFKDNLSEWDAELEKETLTLRLNHPETLFEKGQAILRPRFKAILSDFCPRYLSILDSFQESIDEVRIEGHTSTEWEGANGKDEAYFLNMELSQDRTRSVLQYCMGLDYSSHTKEWMRRRVTANGLSSSRVILRAGEESPRKSRRVEFRIETIKDPQIVRIIDTINQEEANNREETDEN